MTANAACAGAPSGDAGHWHDIHWATCYREVRRLQTRIFKATKEGRWGKVKALQWLLPHSFAGKALAVRRVTENHGKKTPGVDKVTWSTPDAKYRAVKKLSRHGYAPRPLRRIYIPKSNGKMRALGIARRSCRHPAVSPHQSGAELLRLELGKLHRPERGHGLGRGGKDPAHNHPDSLRADQRNA